MNSIYTSESSIHGIGAFSAIAFSPGEIVLRINDARIVMDADPLDPAKGEQEHHCDYLAGGKVILMQQPERFINHNCDPNTYVRTIGGDRFVVTFLSRERRQGGQATAR